MEPVLTASQPQPSEERIFNAPVVAVLLTASIPLLNLMQQWMARSDPYLIVSLAFRPSSLMQDWGWPGVLTSMFLHGGWMHAGMNTLGALAFGPPIARQMVGARGAMAFLLFYIVCGLVATIGYGLIHIQSDDFLVGASGAIFGLTGAALRLLGRKSGRLRNLKDRRFLVPAAVLMGVNALLGLSGLAPGMEAAQIAWEAHAFGFVAGCLLIGPWIALFGDRRKRFDSTVDLRDPPIRSGPPERADIYRDRGAAMLVAEILRSKGDTVYVIGPDLPLSDACIELDTRKVGALIVCDDDRVVGVLSERDIVKAVAADGDAALGRPTSHYMTRDVVFAEPAETVTILMGRMTDRRIRHLPVLREGRLAGVISIGDVVKCQIAEATNEAESLRTYIAAG